MSVSENYLVYKACSKLFGYNTPSTNNIVQSIDTYFTNIFKNLKDFLKKGNGTETRCNDIVFELCDNNILYLSKDEYIDFGFIFINDFLIDISQKDFVSLVETYLIYHFDVNLKINITTFANINI